MGRLLKKREKKDLWKKGEYNLVASIETFWYSMAGYKGMNYYITFVKKRKNLSAFK